MDRPKKKLIIADLFCGAGGESTGIVQACDELGHEYDMLAINHWDRAIETHSKNHEKIRHMCETLQNVDPTKVVPGGRLDLLWASPECTHHSLARGGKPRSDQSRASAWLVLKWVTEIYVDRLIIENVPEFQNWGPLGVDGKPMESMKGSTYTAFCTALESLGYKVDSRVLCAADYGDPTTRKRLFLQAVRGRNKIAWPEATHVENPDNDMFAQEKWVPAKDIIDWDVKGKSIFNRKKPLADNTLKRIEAGIKKYWGNLAEPFLVILRGTSSTNDVNKPLSTVSCSGAHQMLIEPFLSSFHGGSPERNYDVNNPIPTLDCSNRFSLIEPMILGQHSCSSARSISKSPVPTVCGTGSISLITPFLMKYYGTGENVHSITKPVDTITTKDRFAVIDGNTYTLDIRFRMLMPHELAGAQGFPKDYWFSGNRQDQVKQIGNAVPCNLAKSLCMAALVA